MYSAKGVFSGSAFDEYLANGNLLNTLAARPSGSLVQKAAGRFSWEDSDQENETKHRGPEHMTLTVVVGSSGSGKTTFLDHVHKLHSCTYIRQYHTLRPYVPVKKIPKFDPLQLPYWNLYSEKVLKEQAAEGKKNESYNPGVKIGGTMAGEFTAGLSGGQRKMMLFELVRQRTSTQSELLIVRQHGQSAALAMPQLAACASSGRARWLWAARHFGDARASRLQSRRFHRL